MITVWDATYALNTFSTGLVAGAFLMGKLAVRSAAGQPDASEHVLFRHQLIQRLSKLMPPLMLVPVVTSFILLPLSPGNWPVQTAGWLFSVATFGITLTVHAPLNRRFMQWPPNALPPDWETYVGKWDRADSVRLVLATSAFVCAVLSGW
jgi:uncharacterized membrane protein